MAARAEEAASLATRLLARRDLSQRALVARLERGGVDPELAAVTVARFVDLGYVDDLRLAGARALRLAESGSGDREIAARLRVEGLAAADVDVALSGLRPERDRASALAGRIREPRRLAATLRRRGFEEDVIEAAVAELDGNLGPELR